MVEPILVVTFPGGGHLSIEFTDDAPDDDHPRLGAWLELRADDPAVLLTTVLDAGLTELKHPATPTTSWHPAAKCSPSRLPADNTRLVAPFAGGVEGTS
jgi:hypothetical protein